MTVKFRVWDKVQKEMLSWEEIKNLDTNGILTFLDMVEDDRFEVMPYVQLFDDYGKEIYKADMVEIHDTMETKTSHISQVYFSYDGALVEFHPAHKQLCERGSRSLKGYCDYGFSDEGYGKCKIIGNVYENPELIDQIK